MNAARTAAARSPRTAARTTAARTALRAAAALTATATAALAAAALAAPAASAATAAVPLNCAASPHTCGYPDATSTGVPAGTTLQTVPSQISSGPGWAYNPATGTVQVTGNGATLTGLYIPCNLDISASNITIQNTQVSASGSFGISLRHTTGVTIKNSTIAGTSTTTGRLGVAITDIYGDSTAMNITANNISAFKTGIQITTGTITGNYLHDPGYQAGDHTNGIFDGGTTQPLSITGNTILNNLTQTDAISLDASAAASAIANKTITGNYLAGGGYAIYGGASLSNTTSNILIQNNRFGQAYYPTSGQYGPVAYYTTTDPGNSWTGNIWDTTGTTIPAP
jgi:hypothetical protein